VEGCQVLLRQLLPESELREDARERAWDKFCRVRVAGIGDAAAAKAGITGKSPTPAARSRASAGAPDLDANVAMLVARRHRDAWRRPRPRLRAAPPEAHRQNIRRDGAAATAKDIGQRAGSARRSSPWACIGPFRRGAGSPEVRVGAREGGYRQTPRAGGCCG
jgi:hypothetical protein